MSDDAQTLLSRATPRRANGDPIENEIERLRARVAVLEKALRQIQTRPHPSVAAQCIGCYGHQQTATYALEDAAP
jgi:hypothetical protein